MEGFREIMWSMQIASLHKPGFKRHGTYAPSKAIATFVSCRGRCRIYGEVMYISLYNILRF
jgi:hypothetical protein